MKILVLGGTGAMGKHLVQLLSNGKEEVVVTSRQVCPSENRVKYIQGNAQDIKFLQEILQEHWDVIIDFMVYTTIIFKERANLLLNATTQYIFLSSARVYGNIEQSLSEASPRLLESSDDKEFLATDEYALAKARQEDILHSSGCKNWTIIRPYITYSENRLQLGVFEKEEWLYRVLHNKTIIFSTDILTKTTTLTYGLDVAIGIMAIIGRSEALGEIYHITVNEQTTWGDILNIYLTVLTKYIGNKPKIMLLDLDNFLRLETNKYSSVLYDRLFNRVFDCSKIAQYVDINNFISIKVGLTNCMEAFLKNPQFKNIDWRLMGKMDRLTGEKFPLKKIKGFKQKIKYLIFRYYFK
jgi:nucleoside-diphosphate-sugar epimerase